MHSSRPIVVGAGRLHAGPFGTARGGCEEIIRCQWKAYFGTLPEPFFILWRHRDRPNGSPSAFPREMIVVGNSAQIRVFGNSIVAESTRRVGIARPEE